MTAELQSGASDLERKVGFLSAPAFYPHVPACVTVRETHISWVFLASGRL